MTIVESGFSISCQTFANVYAQNTYKHASQPVHLPFHLYVLPHVSHNSWFMLQKLRELWERLQQLQDYRLRMLQWNLRCASSSTN